VARGVHAHEVVHCEAVVDVLRGSHVTKALAKYL
jgi:hypothetical protein